MTPQRYRRFFTDKVNNALTTTAWGTPNMMDLAP
jgi:hypothetical protein